MFRTAGYVFLVLLVGTFAIAWSQGPREQSRTHAETLTPDSYHLKAGTLPAQGVNDMTFVY
jgi:hypothetical protein